MEKILRGTLILESVTWGSWSTWSTCPNSCTGKKYKKKYYHPFQFKIVFKYFFCQVLDKERGNVKRQLCQIL